MGRWCSSGRCTLSTINVVRLALQSHFSAATELLHSCGFVALLDWHISVTVAPIDRCRHWQVLGPGGQFAHSLFDVLNGQFFEMSIPGNQGHARRGAFEMVNVGVQTLAHVSSVLTTLATWMYFSTGWKVNITWSLVLIDVGPRARNVRTNNHVDKLPTGPPGRGGVSRGRVIVIVTSMLRHPTLQAVQAV